MTSTSAMVLSRHFLFNVVHVAIRFKVHNSEREILKLDFIN